MNIIDRFLNYVSIDTTSELEVVDGPSNPNEFVLAKILEKELQDLGLLDIAINKYATVYGFLPGDSNLEPIYLCAHLDTSSQAKGSNIKPKIIKYEGSAIKLNQNDYLKEEEFESLKDKIGHTLITTDGKTLLGGDDKAGIAIIMSVLEYFVNNPNIKHHPIEVIFNSDEEIGIGASHIDTLILKSKYGYTIDGGALKYINIENFNAYSMEVLVKGRSIHPGSAKNKMINAINVAIDFHNSLPQYLRPEHTENKEGFYHLGDIKGNEEETILSYIVREHDQAKLEHMLDIARLSAKRINDQYKNEIITLNINHSYSNMKKSLDKNKHIVEKIEKAYQNLKISYEFEPIRGGTDGAQLTLLGFPTPNIATGDYNCHGRFEYVDVDEMNQVVEIVKEMLIK